MAWTKRDIITKAYAEIGKAAYDFDLQPEELQDALQSLDAMVSAWSIRGINFGYSGGNGKGDIDADTEVPQFAYEALTYNLVLRLAGGMGKMVAQETKTLAKQGLADLESYSLRIRPRKIGGYAGSGSRYSNLPETIDPLAFGRDGNLRLGDS